MIEETSGLETIVSGEKTRNYDNFLYLLEEFKQEKYGMSVEKDANSELFIIKEIERENEIMEPLHKLNAYSVLSLQNCKIEVKYLYNYDEIIITINVSGKITYDADSKTLSLNYKDIKRQKKIVFYDYKSIYEESKTKRFYPLSLKSLCNCFTGYPNLKLLFDFIICFFAMVSSASCNYLYKDILEDLRQNSANVPINMLQISNFYNKKDLLSNMLNFDVPKTVNRISIMKGYYIYKTTKFIDSNFQKKFVYENASIINHLESKYEKDRIRSIFEVFFYERFTKLGVTLDDEDIYMISDYIYMAIKLEKRVNVNLKSINKIVEEHDRLSILYMSNQKNIPAIKILPNNPFKKLKLPKEYKFISTKKALIEESVINQNCVVSYAKSINAGKSGIFTTMYEGKRYTIEIKQRKNKFYINQMSGKKNSKPTLEVKEKLKLLIDTINKDKKQN